MVNFMQKWGMKSLRITLGIVFLWFGALKVLGVSPVQDFIHQTYAFVPIAPFMIILGVWEVVIGLGLIANKGLRIILPLLWLQMGGTFMTFIFAPSMMFSHHDPLLLTTYGEFVAKNIVFIAASLAIGSHELGHA